MDTMSIKFIHAIGLVPFRNFSSKSATARITTTKITASAQSRVYPTTPASKTQWTKQQSQVIAAVSKKQSVFLTGSAGTGKTFLLKHIIKLLKEIYGPSGVFVTASTGVAACALKGQTLHSFAGIGSGASDGENLLLGVISNKGAYKRWKKVKALVIDEISMIPAELFDKLDYIARGTRPRYKKKVWGGIQLIVSGDFFQLPPIIDKKSSSGKEFAFEADCWNSSFQLQIELEKIFRQTDSQLVKLLQGIRRGEVDTNDLRLLKQCPSESDLDPSVVRLYPRNEDVELLNRTRLKDLGREVISYEAFDRGDDQWIRRLKQGMAPDKLDICIGARVMLIKNIDTSLELVNGSTGTVVEFIESTQTDVRDVCGHGLSPVVKFDSGREVIVDAYVFEIMDGDVRFACRKQIPLTLAWALSIHKCQGMTLNSLHTNLSRAFGCGMVYVALSRVRGLGGLYLSGFSPSKIKAHPKVLQFYKNFVSGQNEDEGDSFDKNQVIETCIRDASDSRGDKNIRTDRRRENRIWEEKRIDRSTNFDMNQVIETCIRDVSESGGDKNIRPDRRRENKVCEEKRIQRSTKNASEFWGDTSHQGTTYYVTPANFVRKGN